LGDAVDDRQAEADAGVIGASAFGAALERLGKRRSYVWGELLAGVLDTEDHTLGAEAGRDPHGALFRQVVDDRVVDEVRGHLQQQRVRADGRGDVPGGLDGDAALFCEGEQGFGGLFCGQGQVEVFSGEGPLVGAAEQQQCLGEVDRSGVDGVEAVDELAAVVVRIVAGTTSRRLWVIARGVRSSWEALAANRCCSARWAWSRASMASKLSASSRNSS
jgi:hypothetical protein